MVHAPWLATTGNAGSLRDSANLLEQVGATMAAIYSRTGQPESVIAEWLNGEDHWFSAAEAKRMGLIDEVISNTDTRAAAMRTTPANASANRHKVPSIFSQRIDTMTQQTHNQQPMQSAVNTDALRQNGIRSSFGGFAQREGVAELMARCVNDSGCTVEAANQKLLAHIGSRGAPIAGNFKINFDDNRLADFKAAATDVLMARAGLKVAEMHPAARDIQRLGIVGMAEAMLSMRGMGTRDMSPDAIIKAALSTSDFPSLLANTAGKSLALGYQAASSGHALFTAEREVRDFKPQTLVRLSEGPNLLPVAEHSEYRHSALYDGAQSFTVETHGRIVGISRQALINDDVGSFTSVPQMLGAAARRLEADKTFAQLTGNPVLGDGVALFHANHGNLGSAAALSIASIGVARSAMRKQKDIAGLSFIDPQPKFLIVPVALETAAEQLLASLVDPSKNNATPNVEFIRGLTLIADPRLDASSETAWYLSTDPRQFEGILRAYLAGEARPYLEEDHEFSRDVVSFKVRLDFAVGCIDHRALYKNPGA